jgi:hypothetical protein
VIEFLDAVVAGYFVYDGQPNRLVMLMVIALWCFLPGLFCFYVESHATAARWARTA